MAYGLKKALLAAIMAFLPTTPGADASPKLQLESDSLDFGVLYTGTSVERRLRVRNAGDEGLRIAGARASCASCTVAAVPLDTIEPGKEVEVTISYRAKGPIGQQRSHMFVHSNDPAEPVKTITITATVVSSEGAPRATVSPGKLDIGIAGVRHAYTARLVIGCAQDAKKPLVIQGITASEGCRVVKPVPTQVAAGQKEIVSLEVFAIEPGLLREWVNIETNDPVTPIVNVPIEGYAVKQDSQPALSQQNGLLLQLIGDAVAVPGTGGKFRQELLILNQTSGQVTVKFPSASGSLATAKRATLILKPGEPEVVDLELDPEQVGKSESVRIEIEYPVVEK